MAGLPLAAVAFHLCLLASSSAALRLAPETTSEGRHVGRTAYHFQPAKNWQNGKRHDFSPAVCIASSNPAADEAEPILLIVRSRGELLIPMDSCG
jgi:hypothetical protein